MRTGGRVLLVKVKVKQSHYRPGQALRVPGVWDSKISRQSADDGGKVVILTHRPPLPQEIFLVFISILSLSQPQDHSAIGRIMSMDYSSDIIGNRAGDLPVCSAVPQPTAPPRAPRVLLAVLNLYVCIKRRMATFDINHSVTDSTLTLKRCFNAQASWFCSQLK